MAIEFNENSKLIAMGLAGKNAYPFVNKYSRLCPYCKNAQTYVYKLKNISKEFKKKYVQFVWKFLTDNKIKNFYKKELMKQLDINYISNGVLQDKALTILILLGYIRKELIVYKIIKGEEKIKYKYFVLNERKLPKCYNLIKDKHEDIDWEKAGLRKNYFKQGEGGVNDRE
jgi:hypothetical protein